jgi:hypothetical protein
MVSEIRKDPGRDASVQQQPVVRLDAELLPAGV